LAEELFIRSDKVNDIEKL